MFNFIHRIILWIFGTKLTDSDREHPLLISQQVQSQANLEKVFILLDAILPNLRLKSSSFPTVSQNYQ
jgi:hypothetical protein